MKTAGWIIAAILAILLSFELIRPDPEPQTTTTVRVDTITRTDTVYIPKWHYSEIHFTDTIIDTVQQLIEHNTLYTYSDTLQSDSAAFIVVTDTLYQNRIKARRTQINLYRRDIITTQHHYTPERHLFVGGAIQSNGQEFGLDVMCGWSTRRGMYFVKYEPFTKSVGVGAAWRIL